MRVVVFTSQGWAESILPILKLVGHDVVAVCSQPRKQSTKWLSSAMQIKGRQVKAAVTGQGALYYHDPMQDLLHPQDWARQNLVNWVDANGLKSESFARKMRKLKPEVGIVCGFPRLIPQSVFSVPQMGMINFHPSLLPKHRGATPSRWAIYEGDKRLGVTAHELTEGLDAGAVYHQVAVDVAVHEDWFGLESKLMMAATDCLVAVLNKCESGLLEGVAQDESSASYEKPFRQWHSVIDWKLPCADIARRSRAAFPKWGGIFGIQNKLYSTWELASIAEEVNAAPGTVLSVHGNAGFVDIAAGQGKVRMHKLLLPGGRIHNAQKVFQKQQIQAGMLCMSPHQIDALMGWENQKKQRIVKPQPDQVIGAHS